MSQQLTSIGFSRRFEVVLNPLKYWAVTPGNLFFVVQEFEVSNKYSNLMTKIDNDYCMVIDLGTTKLMDRETEVYLVLRD